MRDPFQEQLQQDLHSTRPSPNASAHQAPDPCSTRQDTLPAQPLGHGPFSIVLAIPARLESSRLPGKLIANINGKPMVRHVLDRCAKAEWGSPGFVDRFQGYTRESLEAETNCCS